MVLSQVEKKVRMNQWDIVRFQLIVYCYTHRIHLSDHDLSCLALLAITGEQTLENFCNLTRNRGIFSSNQSARNSLSKAEKKKLIVKRGINKKKIYLNPALEIQTSGNTLLNYKFFYIEQVLESQES